METIEARMLAPAKVNLYLRILGRRSDGYHLLDSLMVPISLHDQLHVRVTRQASSGSSVTVSSDSPDAPGGPDNLAHRAATLFLQATDNAFAVDIDLRKHIPVGSGLGGGSSDAAAVLLALNRLLGSPYGSEQLAHLATEVGADVPFFIYGRPARVGGVGEQITPLRLERSLALVVCSDGSRLSTAQIYSLVDLSLTSERPATNIAPLVSGLQPVSEVLVNDLESAVAKVHPEVLSLKARLIKQGAQGALMTGSGSAVFGIWPDHRLARNAAMKLRQQGLWAEAVQTLDESPAVAD
jgi:4-diphosphocytidyl-2-C-methyl-D-erythritol kinase